jgi:putative membrane protein
MKRPIARPTAGQPQASGPQRLPRAYAPDSVSISEPDFGVESIEDELVSPPPPKLGWIGKLFWTAGGLLASAAIALAAERLVSELFARNEWLGWLGLGVMGVFLLALIAFIIREAWALRRLSVLDGLTHDAVTALGADDPHKARAVLARLDGVYSGRPDLARARQSLATQGKGLFDGAEQIELAERLLMAPLDARARALTAASARRVALVTTVSPRALIDIAFVIYESVRLGGAIARLYGARPGLLGSWRLSGAILTHLAVTGGLVLTDGMVEQLVGQGLAAKLSARLGEGVVNGLMTVRVGIAAMRVVRPLPFTTQPQPKVRDFVGELANLGQMAGDQRNGDR